MNGAAWSEADLAIVRHMRSDLGCDFAEIANSGLGGMRTAKAVQSQCAKYHWLLPAEQRREMRRRTALMQHAARAKRAHQA